MEKREVKIVGWGFSLLVADAVGLWLWLLGSLDGGLVLGLLVGTALCIAIPFTRRSLGVTSVTTFVPETPRKGQARLGPAKGDPDESLGMSFVLKSVHQPPRERQELLEPAEEDLPETKGKVRTYRWGANKLELRFGRSSKRR